MISYWGSIGDCHLTISLKKDLLTATPYLNRHSEPKTGVQGTSQTLDPNSYKLPLLIISNASHIHVLFFEVPFYEVIMYLILLLLFFFFFLPFLKSFNEIHCTVFWWISSCSWETIKVWAFFERTYHWLQTLNNSNILQSCL